MIKRNTWTQSNPSMQHVTIIGNMENILNTFQNGKVAQTQAISLLRDGICQLAELQPFLEKGCWDNESSKLVMRSDDQILGLIFDQTTPPDKINNFLYKVKAQLDKRNTRRIKRIQIKDAEVPAEQISDCQISDCQSDAPTTEPAEEISAGSSLNLNSNGDVTTDSGSDLIREESPN